MLITERIPNYCDFSRPPMRWRDLEEFLESEFFKGWIEKRKPLTKIDLLSPYTAESDKKFINEYEVELVIYYKDQQRWIAFFDLQKGDNKDDIVNRINEKIKAMDCF